MEKLMNGIQNFVGPLSEKLSSNKFLSAVTEALQIVMPATFVGSFATLFAFIDIGPWQTFLAAHPMFGIVCMQIQTWTLNCMALYVAAALPWRYAEKLGIKQSANMVPLTVAVFLIFSQAAPYTTVPNDFLGHKGLISAMLLGFLIPVVCKFFIDRNITIKMPAGVPKFISDTFITLIPAVVVIVSAAVISQLVAQTEFGTVHNVIYSLIQLPLKDVGLSFPAFLLIEIFMTLLMFTGIHGGVALTVVTPLIAAANLENLEALAAGNPLPNIWVTGLMNSVQIGGIGATLGLGILLVVLAKSERYKKLGRVAIVPQIFNISEPLLFGVPIVLNPLLFIPYMGGILINTCLVYGLVYFGVIGRFTGVEVNWTIPAVLSGALSHSTPLVGALLHVGIIIIDMLIWYPFMKIMDNKALEEEKTAAKKAA